VIGDLNRGGQLQNNAGGGADDTGVILRVQRTAAPRRAIPVPYCSVTTTQTCPNAPAARRPDPSHGGGGTGRTASATASEWRSIRRPAILGHRERARIVDEINRVVPA
jgi:hypothetical protein